MFVRGDHIDHDPGPFGHLQESEVVGGVLRLGDEDAIARLKIERIEYHIPGMGGILDDCHVTRIAIDQSRHRLIDTMDRVFGPRCGFVSADRRFQFEMADDGIDDLFGN